MIKYIGLLLLGTNGKRAVYILVCSYSHYVFYFKRKKEQPR